MAEVMAAHYVEPEESPEVGLERPPRHHHNHHSTTTSTDSTDDDNGDFEKSVYLDNDQGMWKCRYCIWTYRNPWFHHHNFTPLPRGEKVEWSISGNNPGIHQDLDAKLVDSDIGKVLNAFINAQDDHEIKPHDPNTNTSSTQRDHQVTNSAEEREYDEEEEVIELEFERAIKKLDTHTMHCPKCNTQVTKVILRRKRKIIRKEREPFTLLGCLPCLSVFIPSGNRFNMFGIFGTDKPQEPSSLGESIPPTDGTATPLINQSGNGNVVIREKESCFGLFGIFGKENDSGSIKNPPSVDSSSDSLLQQPDGHKVQDEQENKDQGQNSEQKDEAETGSSNYPHAGQKGKYGVGTPPHGVILPGEVRLDIEPELGAKPLGKPSGEKGEGTQEGDHGSRDGDVLLGDQTALPGRPARQSRDQESKSIEIVKSIVYGGLMESITSLSIVASAAASEATTLNILALGLANLVGGIFIIAHNLWDLKDDHRSNPRANKYKELLGRRENFPLHATFAILSFLVFGLIPPVTYGFAFRVSDNKDYKILAVAGAALLSVILLAIGKAYSQRTPKFYLYLKTITFYVTTALAVSGVSYAAGHLAKKYIDELGLFDTNSPVGALYFPTMDSVNPVVLASF